MFRIEGQIDVEVKEAYVTDPKFDAKDNEVNNRNEYVQVFYDVCLLLADKDGNTDTWHGEISNRTGTGTVAHLYRSDLTLQTMRDIGFNVGNLTELEQQFAAAPDRTIIVPNMVGLKCTATVAKSEKTDRSGNPYYNVKYLNALGGGKARRMTMEELMAKRGGAANAPETPAPVQQVAPAPAPAPNYPPQGAPAAQPPPQYQQGYQQSAPAPQGYPQNAAPQAAPNNQNAVPGAPGSPNCPY